jgi:hypothetical protein
VKMLVGLRAIGDALGCSIPTVRRKIAEEGLPVIRWRCAQGPGRQNWAWAINPSLLEAWLLSRAKTDRADALLARQESRSQARATSAPDIRGMGRPPW